MWFKLATSIVYPSSYCKHGELQEDKRSAGCGQRNKNAKENKVALKVTLCSFSTDPEDCETIDNDRNSNGYSKLQ